ncbi:M15 family metallopeptidase [Cyanobium sp. WAJ14-Wanaka]|uniref:M15 family metallopeptidase n=1 Tax=Cyanobium sp. WAJ14-Wanaka TaxID=2823725 RepID=UPI0020CFD0A5|nr:M15 family metallopeptidase [Cyanobium sp. WAJ14-Wanaka]MCP9774592.1 D-alanyl-D-alanine dipeptidase [Cyanobium sp. WAJ14-Wanaka]
MANAPNVRPWHQVEIAESGEPLIDIPSQFHRLEPHPYQSLGAPYGRGLSPFRLRQGVVQRLLAAQAQLQSHHPDWRLAIFDGWRPVEVQAFMVEHAFQTECASRGLGLQSSPAALDAVRAEIGRFWAPASEDPLSPPPHSTGAAVDLTLAEIDGRPLTMGGDIDAIGSISEPNHYGTMAITNPESPEGQWHRQRQLLAAAMASAGFAQHPNEWWHFSHGDQLWAWRSKQPMACYGRAPA